MKALKILLLKAIVLDGVLTTVNSTLAQTWTQTCAPSNNWTGVASSTDGNKLVATADNGGIYISKNHGLSWDLTRAPFEEWCYFS